MLPSTLYGKMVVLLVTLFFLLAVLFAVVAQNSSERYLHEASQKLHSNLAETIVSQNNLPHLTADIGVIERAFGNLIENALRYTSHL